MAENPLLPNRQLQQLYAAMLRVRAGAGSRAGGSEAIFAALAQQLEPGDTVVPAAHSPMLEQMMQPGKRGSAHAQIVAAPVNPPAFAAGLAAAAQLASSARLTVALLDSTKPEPQLASLLDHAQRHRLPLIVICLESSSKPKATAPAPLTWENLNAIVKKLRFPLLTVDGADAVAMYRALQESTLRARQGDGPALLWCLMPHAGSRGKGEPLGSPLARLERYLTARKIPLPKVSAKPAS